MVSALKISNGNSVSLTYALELEPIESEAINCESIFKSNGDLTVMRTNQTFTTISIIRCILIPIINKRKYQIDNSWNKENNNALYNSFIFFL